MSNVFIQNEKIREKIENTVFPTPPSYNQNIKIKDQQSNTYFQEPADPSSKSTSDNYSYFENIDSLIKVFDNCNDVNIIKKMNVYLCGYYLNAENEFPFLQYLMFLDNGRWNFPNIPFQCATNIPENEDGQTPPIHVYFENLCTMHMLEYVEGENMETMFKGYIKSSSLDDTLYVFFDLSQFQIKKSEDIRVMWITMDEMLNGHQCLGFEILKECYSVFYQDVALYTIQNEKGEIMDTPSTMFLCQWKDNDFTNVYNDFEEGEEEDHEYLNGIEERIDHPVLGNFFFFSLHPFEYQSSITKIRRFVGNTRQPIYILHPLSEIVPENSTPSYTLSDVIPSIVSYFSPKSEVVQETKVDGKSDQLEDKDSESGPNLDESKDPILEISPKNSFDDEIASIASLDASCIYFQEYKDGSKTPFWCIKNQTDFVEI